jgi:hypothetical protein
MVVVGAVFATCVTLGFQSCQGSGDEAGEDAACAGLADVTSEADLLTWVAVARTMDVADTATAVVLLAIHTDCSTLTVASGWGAVRRWVGHVGRAAGTAQTLGSSTVACGRWVESPTGSW